MTDFLTFTLDDSRIVARVARIGPTLGRNIRLAISRAVVDLQGYIRTQKLEGQVLVHRTGNLQRAIHVTFPTSDSFPVMGSVGVDRTAPYGKMLTEGTKPHDIVPVRGKALRFMVAGSVVFARRVHHPGTKPMPFMGPAFVESRGSIVARLQGAVAASLKSES